MQLNLQRQAMPVIKVGSKQPTTALKIEAERATTSGVALPDFFLGHEETDALTGEIAAVHRELIQHYDCRPFSSI